MKKIYFSLLLLIITCTSVSAGNVFYNSNYIDYITCVKNLNHEKCGKYNIPQQTAAPESYEPFYLWHYGRHGSRYHYSQDDYTYIFKTLSQADSINNLTEFGKELYGDIMKVYKDAELRAGDLTPRGAMQHKSIAKRMYLNFPNIFESDARIEVKSSTSVRCLLSMNAFTSELLANNPRLKFDVDASKKYLDYIRFGSAIGNGEKVKNLDSFYAKREYKGDLVKRVFKDASVENKDEFIRVLYYMVITLQGLDIEGLDENDCALTQIFTEEEMAEQWQKQNIYWYKDIAFGNKEAAKLISKLLEDVDNAEKNGTSANLMFGHDTGLLPLVSLMNLDGVGNEYNDAETLHEKWQEYRVIPMGGNLQVIFFESKARKENKPVLVKFLLNEREVTLPIKSYSGVYYKWDEVKNYLQKIVDSCKAEENK